MFYVFHIFVVECGQSHGYCAGIRARCCGCFLERDVVGRTHTAGAFLAFWSNRFLVLMAFVGSLALLTGAPVLWLLAPHCRSV